MTNSEKQEISRKITKVIDSMDTDKTLTVDNIIMASLFTTDMILAGFEDMIVEYLEKYNSLHVGFTYMDETCQNRTVSGVYKEDKLLTQSDYQLGSHMARIESKCMIVDSIYLGLSSMEYNNIVEKERVERERVESIEREKELNIDGFASDVKESNKMRYVKILSTLNKDNRKNRIKELIKEGYKPVFQTWTNAKTGKRHENARVFMKGNEFMNGAIVNKTTFEYMQYLIEKEVKEAAVKPEIESVPAELSNADVSVKMVTIKTFDTTTSINICEPVQAVCLLNAYLKHLNINASIQRGYDAYYLKTKDAGLIYIADTLESLSYLGWVKLVLSKFEGEPEVKSVKINPSLYLSFNISELEYMHENKFDDLESDFLFSHSDFVFWVACVGGIIKSVSTYDYQEYDNYMTNNKRTADKEQFELYQRNAKNLFKFYKSKLLQLINKNK